MCILCEAYGTSPIEDDDELEKILNISATYLRMAVDPADVEHIMEFINQITDEGSDFEEEPEIVGNWERAVKDGRLTQND